MCCFAFRVPQRTEFTQSWRQYTKAKEGKNGIGKRMHWSIFRDWHLCLIMALVAFLDSITEILTQPYKRRTSSICKVIVPKYITRILMAFLLFAFFFGRQILALLHFFLFYLCLNYSNIYKTWLMNRKVCIGDHLCVSSSHSMRVFIA